jgi:predicted dienelactone hydrolase
MVMRRSFLSAAAALPLALAAASLPEPAARPPVDAPELARLGRYGVGVAQTMFVQPGQADPASDPERHILADRRLPVTIWYPAAATGKGTTYRTALSGEDGRDVPFTLAGIATPDVRVAPGRFPLVVLAHGYGNSPEVLSWLGENLASKGYVVVTPAFRDPPISIRTDVARAGPIARRPLDVAFVTAEAQRRAQAGEGVLAAAEAGRTALIGYSMGGYGVLTAAGAPLDPAMAGPSRGILMPYAAGGARAGALRAANVKAVIAISPAVRFGAVPIWAGAGAGAIDVPVLLVAGDQDRVVGYDNVRSLFDAPAPAPRYLLTFHEAGHSIALTGAPPAMRRRFWDMDWMEDAVWRKDRLLPIQTHFITAFLDRYVKGQAGKAAYLDGLIEESNDGRWPDAPVGRVTQFSPGAPAATVWKGFQPGRVTGMRFDARR